MYTSHLHLSCHKFHLGFSPTSSSSYRMSAGISFLMILPKIDDPPGFAVCAADTSSAILDSSQIRGGLVLVDIHPGRGGKGEYKHKPIWRISESHVSYNSIFGPYFFTLTTQKQTKKGTGFEVNMSLRCSACAYAWYAPLSMVS